MKNTYLIVLFCVSGCVEPENVFFDFVLIFKIYFQSQESKKESTIRRNLNERPYLPLRTLEF